MKRAIYNGVVVPAARLVLPVVSRLRPKVARGIEARRGLLDRWREVADRLQGRSPRIWLHASSAGETLQARPLGDAIRRDDPEAALVYTFFSPSAERLATEWGAPDAADYLPFDVPRRIEALLDVLDPDAIVLVGAELWPNLVWEAHDRGVLLAQVCCRLGPESGRTGPLGRALARDLYPRFTAIGAVAGSDAEAVVGLGADPEAVAITGDIRVDATLARVAAAADSPPVWTPPAGREPIVVAGSTWPRDEPVVLEAVARLRARESGLVAIVAPHEPTDEALDRVESAASDRGLETARLAELEADPALHVPPVVLVDRVGILYRLYAGAAAAYVGGGFDGAVHNTMEPAAQGAPVAIGPDHGGPHEVSALRASGALAQVETGEGLADVWGRWLDDPSAGRAARETIERLGGATGRTLDHLRRWGVPV